MNRSADRDSGKKGPRMDANLRETKTNRRWTQIRSGWYWMETFVLQREVFKHFDEDSRPREDKIIHNKVAKAAKTNHLSKLSRDCLSSWPLCPCCEISGFWLRLCLSVNFVIFCENIFALPVGPAERIEDRIPLGIVSRERRKPVLLEFSCPPHAVGVSRRGERVSVKNTPNIERR